MKSFDSSSKKFEYFSGVPVAPRSLLSDNETQPVPAGDKAKVNRHGVNLSFILLLTRDFNVLRTGVRRSKCVG